MVPVQWTYRTARVDVADDDATPSGWRRRHQRAYEEWCEKLNKFGADGGELVSEHITTAGNSTSIFGTLKFRHDTEQRPD